MLFSYLQSALLINIKVRKKINFGFKADLFIQSRLTILDLSVLERAAIHKLTVYKTVVFSSFLVVIYWVNLGISYFP
jgi:hypothetical protein